MFPLFDENPQISGFNWYQKLNNLFIFYSFIKVTLIAALISPEGTMVLRRMPVITEFYKTPDR